MQDVGASGPGKFVLMAPDMYSSGMMPVRNANKMSPPQRGAKPESFVMLELRMASARLCVSGVA